MSVQIPRVAATAMAALGVLACHLEHGNFISEYQCIDWRWNKTRKLVDCKLSARSDTGYFLVAQATVVLDGVDGEIEKIIIAFDDTRVRYFECRCDSGPFQVQELDAWPSDL